MKTQINAFATGTSIVEVATTDLPACQYFVKLQMENAVEYRKLIVEPNVLSAPVK